eukprot:TRINITY_DN35616_c0_g1_i1.p2 TRINITY_DN35616_c0_g1~~TRINITY_DN35616_c0_g1_i1.p2  ORF type:complete len:107 (-),score=1.40 TRINITY_DN35616_c0_g1_i1:132-452(-)
MMQEGANETPMERVSLQAQRQGTRLLLQHPHDMKQRSGSGSGEGSGVNACHAVLVGNAPVPHLLLCSNLPRRGGVCGRCPWRDAGHPLEKGGATSSRTHPFGAASL